MNKKVSNLVNNLIRLIKDRNMDKLKKPLYQFINLNCGFIAHYNIDGFKSTYNERNDFIYFLKKLKNGCEIYHCDKEDNYNYGYINEEVKIAFKDILTDNLLNQIESEIIQENTKERRQQYLDLRGEFEP